ncbi:MAG: NAD-dependent epimerase/dehydratase family protein [Myxococcales bacterium]|nr:NAD-dependent epimerase/dehydratase family protein [Myxococcales bacterium]MCB9547823.1 NAD-dependent epimerase/dehydratase family protein [Myxococcales bacterium]
MAGPIAVTGATGFIGSHVIRVLLERGYAVRACVRDPDDAGKVAHLRALAEGLPGSLTFHRGDLLEAGSYDEAFAGATGVIHTAAAVTFTASDPEAEIVRPSLEGTANVLGAAERSGTVQRFVHTSSVSGVVSKAERGRTYTEADYSDEATIKSDAYAYAKREAERLVMAHAAGFSRVSLNPGLVVGPVYTKAHAKGSVSVVRDFVVGTFPGAPPFAFSVVDVRDVATAHVDALEKADLSGRFILSAATLWMREMAAAVAKALPGVKVRTNQLPSFLIYLAALFDKRMSLAMVGNLLKRPQTVDNARSRAELGVTYLPIEESIATCARSMIDQGFAKPKGS